MDWFQGGWQVDWMSLTMALGMVVIMLLVLIMTRPVPPTARSRSPEELLRLRYLAGDIDRETYVSLREELQGRVG